MFEEKAMDLFDTINVYLMNHPIMLDQLQFAFRIKYWVILGLALYFVCLPYRQHKKDLRKQKELAKTRGHFLA